MTHAQLHASKNPGDAVGVAHWRYGHHANPLVEVVVRDVKGDFGVVGWLVRIQVLHRRCADCGWWETITISEHMRDIVARRIVRAKA